MIKMKEEKEKNNNQLPEDWKWVKVGQYVISVKGKKPKRVSKEKTKECSIPYVNIKAFEKNIIDEYTDGVGCALCEDGDFLMVWDGSRSGYVGKAIKGALGSTLVKLNFPNIENNYAYYFLQSKFIEINTRAKGVGIPHVDPNILWNYDLLIPPKPTQQAIVSKIEELFSELDKGIENLHKAQGQLKTYRQSVLKWAFEGKLTNGLNHDLPAGQAGSDDLHDEHDLNIAAEPGVDYKTKKNHGNRDNPVNNGSDKGELPKGWRWVLINEIGKIKGGKRLPPKHQYSEEPTDFVYIMAGNLKNGTVTNKYRYIEEKTYNALLNYKVMGGEVYITIVGACIGDAGIIPEKIGKSILTENAAKIIELKDVLNKYLALWINSTSCQANIKNNILSATLGKLALNRIGTLEVPVPPIEEQYKIVEAIESRLSVADKMEESITQSLQQAEALRQSILKKAFEGKLVY